MYLPKILVFAGSIRTGSYNAQLAGVIVKALAARQCEPTRITLVDYPLPIYDADMEKESGIPDNAQRLARLFHEHDAVVIVSPEYNSSMTPLTKNTIDWISRVRSDARGKLVPYKNKVFALAAASEGALGGMRGLFHLRQTLVGMGALVLSEQLALAGAHQAYDAMENLVGERPRLLLDELAGSVVEKAALLRAERA